MIDIELHNALNEGDFDVVQLCVRDKENVNKYSMFITTSGFEAMAHLVETAQLWTDITWEFCGNHLLVWLA